MRARTLVAECLGLLGWKEEGFVSDLILLQRPVTTKTCTREQNVCLGRRVWAGKQSGFLGSQYSTHLRLC